MPVTWRDEGGGADAVAVITVSGALDGSQMRAGLGVQPSLARVSLPRGPGNGAALEAAP